jgi:hypothetical protein
MEMGGGRLGLNPTPITTKCPEFSYLKQITFLFIFILHRDLRIETVTDIIAKFAKSHEKRLQDHINFEASRLLNMNNITRLLKWKRPLELVIR